MHILKKIFFISFYIFSSIEASNNYSRSTSAETITDQFDHKYYMRNIELTLLSQENISLLNQTSRALTPDISSGSRNQNIPVKLERTNPPYQCPTSIKNVIKKFKTTTDYLCFQPCQQVGSNCLEPTCNAIKNNCCDPILMYLARGQCHKPILSNAEYCFRQCIGPCAKANECLWYTACCCWACEN